MATQCLGTNRDGGPCSGHVNEGRQWCQWHDPELEAKRQADRAAGGRAKSNQSRARKRLLASARTMDEVDAALCGALERVLAGDLEPNVGTAAAGIARAIVATRQAGDLETRLRVLEERAGAGKESA